MKESTLLKGTAEALRALAAGYGAVVDVHQSPGDLLAALRVNFSGWRILLNAGECEGMGHRGAAKRMMVEVTVQQSRGWQPSTAGKEGSALEFCDRVDLVRVWMRSIRFYDLAGQAHPRMDCDAFTFVREAPLELEDGGGLAGTYQRVLTFEISHALPWVTEEVAVRLPNE